MSTTSYVRGRRHLTAYRLQRGATRFLTYLAVVLLSVVFAFPLIWSLASSLKQIHEFYLYPPTWIPQVPQWHNYIEVFHAIPAARWPTSDSVFTTRATGPGSPLSGTTARQKLRRSTCMVPRVQ